MRFIIYITRLHWPDAMKSIDLLLLVGKNVRKHENLLRKFMVCRQCKMKFSASVLQSMVVSITLQVDASINTGTDYFVYILFTEVICAINHYLANINMPKIRIATLESYCHHKKRGRL